MKPGLLALATAAGLLMASAAMAIDVKIGVLNDRSGVYADLSGEGSVIAARMAVEDFDAAAKGINVEIVSADHQNKPDIASNVARQWFDAEGVDVIVDVPTSVRRARGERDRPGEEQDLPQLGRRDHRPDRQGLRARRRSTGPTTPTRSPTAPAAPWSPRAATPGSS